VVPAPALTLVGLQAKAETSVGATRLNEALCELPFRLAVMLADWFVVIVPRLVVKVVEALLAGTATDTGTLRTALLLESPTAVPPAGAA
jgi:hypothetical protein